MRTTKKLSEALQRIETEAILRIKKFFTNKPYVRIFIEPHQHLVIDTGTKRIRVLEINSDASIVGVLMNVSQKRELYQPQDLPADALLTILDELERMKKTKLLNKP